MQELIDKIYFATSLDGCDVPSDVILYYLEEWGKVFPDNECLVLHNTVVSIYEWLIQKASKDATGGASREEKVGNVQIKEGATDKTEEYEKALDTYLENPSGKFPSCREVLVSTGRRVIIGGTSRNEVNRVRDRDDSYSQYDERSPYSPNTRRRCRRRGFTCGRYR
tara:strand:- start:1741 stop:2238 length:498 start_codon:yes stop_codon:yes gene_type:complete